MEEMFFQNLQGERWGYLLFCCGLHMTNYCIFVIILKFVMSNEDGSVY